LRVHTGGSAAGLATLAALALRRTAARRGGSGDEGRLGASCAAGPEPRQPTPSATKVSWACALAEAGGAARA
jgi:hypothetical protein